jgi:hypothetical protein
MEIGCGDGALGYQVFLNCVESLGLGHDGDNLVVTLLLLHRKPELMPCFFSYPLEANTLKVAYNR